MNQFILGIASKVYFFFPVHFGLGCTIDLAHCNHGALSVFYVLVYYFDDEVSSYGESQGVERNGIVICNSSSYTKIVTIPLRGQIVPRSFVTRVVTLVIYWCSNLAG